MSKQTINIGASPNDGTGTPLRTSFDYTNQNFTEIYTALGGGVALPGATTQVIFNDGGTNLAGDAGLVYNKTTDALTVAGLVTAGSATISGDLTVRTTKLAVTSTGVGVGTVTPNSPSHFYGSGRVMQFQPAASTASTFLAFSSDNFVSNRALVGIDGSASSIWAVGGVAYSLNIGTVDSNSICFGASNAELYRIAPSGVFNWYNGAGGTRMTLDSTGLGIGVTPSAWNSDYKSIDIGANGCIAGRVGNSNTLDIISNGFRNAAGNYVYKSAVSAPAARYLLDGSTGSHIWFSGVAGTAGNTIAGFTTAAMTLDASGRLLVGGSSSGSAVGDGIVKLGFYGHCISQTGVSIASGSFVDLTIVTSGAGYQGFLSVANTQDVSANTRTQTTYSVFGRGASATFTQIATANGSIGGATFTVTTPSNGVIRITNTSGLAATISAQFFGGVSA